MAVVCLDRYNGGGLFGPVQWRWSVWTGTVAVVCLDRYSGDGLFGLIQRYWSVWTDTVELVGVEATMSRTVHNSVGIVRQ